MIGCLQTHVRKQPIIVLYFEFETVLKFYNLEAWLLSGPGQIKGSLSLNNINHIKEIFFCISYENTIYYYVGCLKETNR